MNLKQEKQLLAHAELRLDQIARRPRFWAYELYAWLVLAGSVATGILIVGGPMFKAALAVGTGFFGGLLVTFLLLKRLGMSQWCALAPFIDRKGLRARIEQLGA